MNRALVPVLSAVGLGLLSTGTVQADTGRHFVVAAGGDSSVFIPEDAYAQERATLGYFGRLSYETPVPEYTSASRGYVWNFGIDPDIEFSRSWDQDAGEMTIVEAGLRLSVPFSQRRMGLFEVSARGGFWLAVRGGLSTIRNEQQTQGMTSMAPTSGSLPMEPEQNGMLLDLSFGEFILLGDSGLRIEAELSGLIAEHPELLGGSPFGLRMRAGLGAYF